MKLYVIKHWCESNIAGVFDTKEGAMDFITNLGLEGTLDVLEFTLNEAQPLFIEEMLCEGFVQNHVHNPTMEGYSPKW